KQCIGFAFNRGPQGYEAFSEEKSLGLYQTREAAIGAVIDARRAAPRHSLTLSQIGALSTSELIGGAALRALSPNHQTTAVTLGDGFSVIDRIERGGLAYGLLSQKRHHASLKVLPGWCALRQGWSLCCLNLSMAPISNASPAR